MLALLTVAMLARSVPVPVLWGVVQKTLQNPVEQQTPGGMSQPDRTLWVNNPTTYYWDADDLLRAVYAGIIETGGRAIHLDKVIADNEDHLVSLSVCAEKQAQFAAWLTLSQADGTVLMTVEAKPPQPFGNQIICTKVCLGTPQFKLDSTALAPIPGSGQYRTDGKLGVGKIYSVSWTVANVGDRRIRNLGAEARVDLVGNVSVNNGCPNGWSTWDSRECIGYSFSLPDGKYCWDR